MNIEQAYEEESFERQREKLYEYYSKAATANDYRRARHILKGLVKVPHPLFAEF